MSGHSKWSTIKRKKGVADAKRGKIFTKLIRELTISARNGGDESSNPQLRSAVQNAKGENMPQATIDRAIRRGTGVEPGVTYEASMYEGYGPGGVAIMVETLSDNRNRAVAELRHVFSKYNGSLAENGAVAWMFEQKAVVEVPKNAINEEDLLLTVMDAGADDIHDGDEVHEVVSAVVHFEAVKQALEVTNTTWRQASLAWLPQTMVKVEAGHVERIIHLLEALEDLDDVQNVFSNFDIGEEELQKIMA